ncbi:MAG TPA: hypothetical protein VD864_16865, partial [Nocardioides sp.]|nr:hypothetical protein [Nocardioides sp.]
MTSTAHATTRYSDPFVCPDCSARLPLRVVTCPGCGLRLDVPLASELLRTLRTADDLLARLRAESADPSAPAAAGLPPYPAPRPAPQPAPPPARHQPGGLSALSVPKILLGLGALCLLVAAVIFLAVAWSWLGVGGRTAVLVALTLVSGGLGVWLGRRGLRVAAEAMTTVGLGLLALDVVGADNAGWLGDVDAAGLTCAVGGAVLVAALALAQTTRLGAPQVGSVLALSVAGVGAIAASGHLTTVLAAGVLAHLALVAAGRLRSLRLGEVLAALGAGGWWLALTMVGLGDAATHPAVRALWLDGYAAGLLLAALLLLLPVPFVRAHPVVPRALVAGSALVLTLTAGLPALDEGASVLGASGVVALAGWTVASWALPSDWRPVARVPMLLAALPVLVVTLGLLAQATGNAVDTGEPFLGTAGMRLDDPEAVAWPALLALGVGALLLAAISLAPHPTAVRPQLPAGVLLAAGVATLALFPVPLAVLVAAVLLLGAGLLAESWRHRDRFAQGQALVGLGMGVGAVALALPSDVLTAVAAGALVAMAALLASRGTADVLRTAGGLVVPGALALLVWSAASAAGTEQVQRGVPVLLAVGLLAIAVPRVELELTAALAGLLASLGAIATADDLTVALAVHLTVAGGLVCASALVHPERRALGWAGGLLLASATWVRLADVGVTAPEAYTMPSAVALLLVGLHRLWRDPA